MIISTTQNAGSTKMRTLFLVLLLSGLVFAQNGSVNFIIGKVQIQLPGETRWKTAKIGQEMPERSKVKTFAESRCEIMLADGSVIKVLENTEVNLNKLGKTEKEETSIFSPFGELFLTVKSIFTRNPNGGNRQLYPGKCVPAFLNKS